MRKGVFSEMLRRAFVPSLFELYQLLIAVLGMIGVYRILFEYAWVRSTEHAVITMTACWFGRGLVSLFQNRKNHGPRGAERS